MTASQPRQARASRTIGTRTEPSLPAVERLAEDEEIVAGRRPVEEAFAARRASPAAAGGARASSRPSTSIVLHATTLRIPVVEVEGGTLTALCGFDGHQGVALVVEPRPWSSLEDVLAVARARGEPPFVLVLDPLEDPQNVGTLLRCCRGLRRARRALPDPARGAAQRRRREGLGRCRRAPAASSRSTDVAAGLVDLHAVGVRIVGADETAPLTFRDADMRGPVAVVVGSEGYGMGARVRRRIDVLARIPMRGRVASLNAAVAGSILLFEAAMQRALPDPGPAPAGDDHEAEGLPGRGRPQAHLRARGRTAPAPVEASDDTPAAARPVARRPRRTPVTPDQQTGSGDTDGGGPAEPARPRRAADASRDEALLPEPRTG